MALLVCVTFIKVVSCTFAACEPWFILLIAHRQHGGRGGWVQRGLCSQVAARSCSQVCDRTPAQGRATHITQAMYHACSVDDTVLND